MTKSLVAAKLGLATPLQRAADGKVTGSAGSGSGRFLVAVGDAAPLAGRKYTYSFKTVAGQMQYAIDVKVE